MTDSSASVIETASGKKLEVKECTPGKVMQILDVAGERSPSGSWIRYACFVCSVEAIDGVPVMMPKTKVALEQLADRLGNDGIVAVADFFSSAEKKSDEEGSATNTDPDIDAAKN